MIFQNESLTTVWIGIGFYIMLSSLGMIGFILRTRGWVSFSNIKRFSLVSFMLLPALFGFFISSLLINTPYKQEINDDFLALTFPLGSQVIIKRNEISGFQVRRSRISRDIIIFDSTRSYRIRISENRLAIKFIEKLESIGISGTSLGAVKAPG